MHSWAKMDQTLFCESFSFDHYHVTAYQHRIAVFATAQFLAFAVNDKAHHQESAVRPLKPYWNLTESANHLADESCSPRNFYNKRFVKVKKQQQGNI